MNRSLMTFIQHTQTWCLLVKQILLRQHQDVLTVHVSPVMNIFCLNGAPIKGHTGLITWNCFWNLGSVADVVSVTVPQLFTWQFCGLLQLKGGEAFWISRPPPTEWKTGEAQGDAAGGGERSGDHCEALLSFGYSVNQHTAIVSNVSLPAARQFRCSTLGGPNKQLMMIFF